MARNPLGKDDRVVFKPGKVSAYRTCYHIDDGEVFVVTESHREGSKRRLYLRRESPPIRFSAPTSAP